jgi:hypothetical protein
MAEPSPSSDQAKTPASGWMEPVDRLKVAGLPAEAVNLNVDDRQVIGLLRGFGQLWRKTYRMRLEGARVSPAEVIKVWKEDFPKFWPKGNYFYGSTDKIAPGEVAVLNLAGPGGMTGPGGAPLISTGIIVMYADDESFSFMMPQGHMFAGMITFSAFEEEGCTVAQAQALVRPYDPVYELSFRLGFGHAMEDAMWTHTVQAVAAHFGVMGKTQKTVVCEDRKLQWAEAKNLWHNAAIRTALYTLMAPLRWVQNVFRRKA